MGDAVLGVFATLGVPQMIVLTVLVINAGGLRWLSRRFDRAGLLH